MSSKSFDPDNVAKGTKEFGYINIVDNLAANFDMPVGIVNGAKDGPTLAVTGGLYPTEYHGVSAAARLYQLLDPDKLAGKFITVPVVNMYTFQFRNPTFELIQSSTTPLDRGRINSYFPGSPDNHRPTQVLAYKLFNILKKANYHLDFRGGDLNESHLVHSIYLRIGTELDQVAETMAKVAGYRFVLPGTPDIGHTAKGTLIYELMNAGCASIITENGLGYRQQPYEHFIQGHMDGTLNIMKHFGMLEGDPVKPENQKYLDMKWVRVPAPASGMFVAIADAEDILTKGQVIGHIRDLDGSIIAEVKSPIDGVVHTMYPRRVVNINDGLYTLLAIGETTGW